MERGRGRRRRRERRGRGSGGRRFLSVARRKRWREGWGSVGAVCRGAEGREVSLSRGSAGARTGRFPLVVSFSGLPTPGPFSFYPVYVRRAIQNADLIRANLTPSSRSCFGELNPSPRCPPSFAASLCLASGKSSIQRGEFKIQT